jgi:putative zinc finger/helix-turn-helix YgiT family protein
MTEKKTGDRAAHVCQECGSALAMRNYKHTEKVGKVKVTDATGQVPTCTKCGEAELSLTALAGYQRRAAAIALRDARSVDGPMVRYARKALGLRQTDLAELIGCASETLSRWETDALEMPRNMQLALVAVLDGVEHHGGDVDDYLAHDRERHSVRSLEVPARRTG